MRYVSGRIARTVPMECDPLARSLKPVMSVDAIRMEESVSRCGSGCLRGRSSAADVAFLTREKQQAYRRKARPMTRSRPTCGDETTKLGRCVPWRFESLTF